jgi:hypothetical protein
MVMSVLQVVLDLTREGMTTTMIIVTDGGVPSNSLSTHAMSASKSHYALYGPVTSCSGLTRAPLSANTTEDWPEGGQYPLRVILGSSLRRPHIPTGPRLSGFAARYLVRFGIQQSLFRPRPSVGRARGTLASVRILGHIQESKDSNTEETGEDHGVHGAENNGAPREAPQFLSAP